MEKLEYYFIIVALMVVTFGIPITVSWSGEYRRELTSIREKYSLLLNKYPVLRSSTRQKKQEFKRIRKRIMIMIISFYIDAACVTGASVLFIIWSWKHWSCRQSLEETVMWALLLELGFLLGWIILGSIFKLGDKLERLEMYVFSKKKKFNNV